MDWNRFTSIRGNGTIRTWYERLANQPADCQARYHARFAVWTRRAEFQGALQREHDRAVAGGQQTLIRVGSNGVSREYLREFFELFACDHMNADSVRASFSTTPERILLFLEAQEELQVLVECLLESDFT